MKPGMGLRACVVAVILGWSAVCPAVAAAKRAAILIDYPMKDTVFPPDISAPTFLWRDDSRTAKAWAVEISFGEGGRKLRLEAAGTPYTTGELDPRAVAETNEPPKLTAEQAASRTWTPDPEVWAEIKRRSTKRPATVTVTGYADDRRRKVVSEGRVPIRTSTDPVGAPIFYRDVPLMPSELEKGIIKPLAPAAIPLIAWRLRDVSETSSRVLMDGLHTCANCHSFSRDGKTLGLDMDGPQNDKGLYAIVPVAKRMTIRTEDMVQWSSFRGRLGSDLRVGFMSQVSPDGKYVVTMIDRPDTGTGAANRGLRPGRGHFYVANFKDYRFLQVFYPTRGILAWYDRATGKLQPLPGADDPRYVHTNAVWAPDGKHLVFARAPAKDPYPDGAPLAGRANDPNETPIQYDLYRIPFNDGNGGKPEPIVGASRNGMSNTFPKVSPDGRWIVYVQCKNGQLMRPDSQLYIVPSGGGESRRMNANTKLMNSWHSFSPNGRWLVFSSKSRSPYTQMYLTHLDERGEDTPPVLVENTTAANRAVNIPEFVNVPHGGIEKIDVPAVEYYRQFDLALDLTKKGRDEAALAAWKKAQELDPNDAKTYLNMGLVLARLGQVEEAVVQYKKVLALDPGSAEAHSNLGLALTRQGRPEEGIAEYKLALKSEPDYPEVHSNLGAALAGVGKLDEAISHFKRVLELRPDSAEGLSNLGRALASAGRTDEAVALYEKAVELRPDSAEARNGLGVALIWKKRVDEAVKEFEKAVSIRGDYADARQNLGDTLYYLQGRGAEGLAQWREVLRLRPDHVVVLNQTARALATHPEGTIRNGAEAVILAERASKLTGGKEPVILDTLAAAYAESGRFTEAVATAREAEKLAVQTGKQPLAESIRSRIALYEAGTPFRRSP
jgi:tetratricopeptide (TPR) repeat protein